MNYNEEIKDYIKNNCIKKGNFTLSSGVKSNTYVDIKKLLLNQKYLSYLGQTILEMLDDDISVITGMELGAIPIIFSSVIYSEINGKELRPVIIRKKQKKYGISERAIGIDLLKKNSKICIIEDVITTGKTVREVIDIIEKNNHSVSMIISIVDRCDNKFPGYNYKTFFQLPEIL